jgi:hypothetical protein
MINTRPTTAYLLTLNDIEREACYGLLDRLSMVWPEIPKISYWKERVKERELAERKKFQIVMRQGNSILTDESGALKKFEVGPIIGRVKS